MQIPNKILKKWKSLQSTGDIEALVALTERTRPIINKAFNGKATLKVFKTIKEFYEKREKEINE